MAERVLTRRDLNRALLARQLLLERSRLSVPRALERMAGIQDQYAPNASIRLWSCLEGFRRDDLTRALGSVAGTWRYEDGRVRWDAFTKLGTATGREVDDEAERLAAFHV